jgi:hypothetical protein
MLLHPATLTYSVGRLATSAPPWFSKPGRRCCFPSEMRRSFRAEGFDLRSEVIGVWRWRGSTRWPSRGQVRQRNSSIDELVRPSDLVLRHRRGGHSDRRAADRGHLAGDSRRLPPLRPLAALPQRPSRDPTTRLASLSFRSTACACCAAPPPPSKTIVVIEFAVIAQIRPRRTT